MAAVDIATEWARGTFRRVLAAMAAEGRAVCEPAIVKVAAAKGQAAEAVVGAVLVVYLGKEVLDGEVACVGR